MRPVLTQRQNEVLEFIRAYQKSTQRPPTLEEIGEAMGIRSPTGVRKHLIALEQKGYLERELHASRGIRLTDSDLAPLAGNLGAVSVPLVKLQFSGPPKSTPLTPAAYLKIDSFFLSKVPDPTQCVLCVNGDDGMSASGIRKGDFLLIEQCPYPQIRNKEPVAVSMGLEVFVRTLVRRRKMTTLRPTNNRFSSTTLDPHQTRVIGRVISVIRRL